MDTSPDLGDEFKTQSNGRITPTPPRDSNVNLAPRSKMIDEIPAPPSPTPISFTKQPRRSETPRHSNKQQRVFNYSKPKQRKRASSTRHSAPMPRTASSVNSKRPVSAGRYRYRAGSAGAMSSAKAKTSDYIYNFRNPGAVFGGTPRACNLTLKGTVPPVGLYEPKIMGKSSPGIKISRSKRFSDKRSNGPVNHLYMPKSSFKGSKGCSWGKAKRFHSRKDTKPGPGQYTINHNLNHGRLPYAVFTARKR